VDHSQKILELYTTTRWEREAIAAEVYVKAKYAPEEG
jgi:hypothetical protein